MMNDKTPPSHKQSESRYSNQSKEDKQPDYQEDPDNGNVIHMGSDTKDSRRKARRNRKKD